MTDLKTTEKFSKDGKTLAITSYEVINQIRDYLALRQELLQESLDLGTALEQTSVISLGSILIDCKYLSDAKQKISHYLDEIAEDVVKLYANRTIKDMKRKADNIFVVKNSVNENIGTTEDVKKEILTWMDSDKPLETIDVFIGDENVTYSMRKNIKGNVIRKLTQFNEAAINQYMKSQIISTAPPAPFPENLLVTAGGMIITSTLSN